MMKRTIPGGRIESVFSQSRDGKEVLATKLIEDEDGAPALEVEEEVVAESTAENQEPTA